MSDDNIIKNNDYTVIDPKDDLVLNKIQNDFLIKQNKFRTLSQKSFILNNEEHTDRKKNILARAKSNKLSQKDQDLGYMNEQERFERVSLDELINSTKKQMMFKREVQRGGVFSRAYWQDKTLKNVELFSVNFLELNAILFTYVINTFKTRWQARNVHTDVAHLVKNHAEKAPKMAGIGYLLVSTTISNTIYSTMTRISGEYLLKNDATSSWYWHKILTR